MDGGAVQWSLCLSISREAGIQCSCIAVNAECIRAAAAGDGMVESIEEVVVIKTQNQGLVDLCNCRQWCRPRDAGKGGKIERVNWVHCHWQSGRCCLL